MKRYLYFQKCIIPLWILQKNTNTLLASHRQKLRFLGFFKLFKKIPTLIWATFAIIGMLVVGVAIGINYSESTYISPPTEYEILKNTNDQYLNVIRGYETISDLYYSQGKNVSVIMGADTLRNNPTLAQKALSNMESVKDQILLQLGRIQEIRKNANLPQRDLQKAQ